MGKHRDSTWSILKYLGTPLKIRRAVQSQCALNNARERCFTRINKGKYASFKEKDLFGNACSKVPQENLENFSDRRDLDVKYL